MSTLNIDKNEVNRFSYLINYDITIFFDLYRTFVNNNLPNIVSFYKDSDNIGDQYSFNFLKKLKNESIIVDNLIKTNMSLMTNMSAWEILDFFEDIKIKLDTFSNLGKWTRSNKTVGSVGKTSTQIEYTLGRYESLEEVSGLLNGSNNQNDDWQQIAIANNLTEAEYTTSGGNLLKLSKDLKNAPNTFLESVIDSMVGEKMYGKDIDRKLTLEVDEDGDCDLKILDYSQTVTQNFDTLLTLKKGDVPEFPNMGINNVVGSNVMSFYYVSLTKQLRATFDTDDSLRDFSVINISYKNGDLYLRCSVNTFYNLTLDRETKI